MAARPAGPRAPGVTAAGAGRSGGDPAPTPLGLILFAASLSAAFLEAIVGILPGFHPFSSLPRTVLSLAVTALLFLPFHALLCAVSRPLHRNADAADPRRLAIGSGVFLGTALLLASLNDLVYLPLYTTDILKLGLILAVSILAALGASALADRALARPAGGRRLNRILFGTPLLAGLAFLVVWRARYGLGSPISAANLALGLGVIAAAAAVILASSRVEKGRGATVALFVFFAAILVLPAAAIRAGGGSPARAPGAAEGAPRIRNVLLLTADTLRADALSLYGGAGASTPAIDALADDAILFTGAMTPAPWTLPAVASLMTGLPPSVHGMVTHRSRLPDGFRTLAERMRDAGYRTAAIGSNPYLKEASNLSQGFDDYRFFGGVPRLLKGGPLGARLVRRFVRDAFPPWGSTEDLTRMAVAWLEENHRAPFFLWLFYLDPHVPYAPPTDLLPAREPPASIGTVFAKQTQVRSGYFSPTLKERAWIRDLYLAEVRHLDRNVGRILSALKRLDLYDDTLIILTSDHGEEFWEHGGFEHGHSLYDEVIRVPLLIKRPGAPSGGRAGGPLSTGSVMPTVLDLCGIEREIHEAFYPSLAPFLSGAGEALPGEPVVVSSLVYFEDRVSVIFDEMKYIRALVSGREELFDLGADPGERSSVAEMRPEALERARRILAGHERAAADARRLYALSGGDEAALDPEEMETLRSLGYVD